MAIHDPDRTRRKIGELPPGPVAVIVNEDDVDVDATIAHHRRLGFAGIVQVGAADSADATAAGDRADISCMCDPGTRMSEALSALMPALLGRWVYAGYNAEFLFFPFCETRSVSDLTQFISEERRDAAVCVTVDLYSDSPDIARSGIASQEAFFDRAGYFALDRYDGPQKLDRQVDVFGGLKWRFSEHVPWERQRIDRVGLFRARPDLVLDDNHLSNDPEMNTLNCAWHNNLTCAIASLRVAKSLLKNPGSTFEINGLCWSQSERFDWTSQQLMDHGLLEPGQWF